MVELSGSVIACGEGVLRAASAVGATRAMLLAVAGGVRGRAPAEA